MKEKFENSSFKKRKREIITDINNNNYIEDKSDTEKKYSEFNLGSDYFNINESGRKSKKENIDDNSIFSSITSGEEDFNFYNVEKTNIINYMTPIKVNNAKNNKKKLKKNEKNKTNQEISEEIFSISNSNSNEDDKKIMISELDIELSNNSKNSQKNFYTNYKTEINDIKSTKKRKKKNKKQIEQNLKKFLQLNQENNKDNKDNNNNIDINNNKNKETTNDKNLNTKMRLKKQLQNIKYYFTKVNTYKKKIPSNKNTINAINANKNSNKLSSIITMKKKNPKLYNNLYKTKTENVSNNNFHKKFNAFVKINVPIKPKKNKDKKTEFKNRIFFFQNKNLNNKIIKSDEFNDYIIYNKNNNNKYNSINNKKIRNEFFKIKEKKRVIDNQENNNYNFNYNTSIKQDDSNINEKNIIIQNFNCIDYNSINISINNNNNNNAILKKYKLSHRRNIDKNNISNNITKKTYNTINNNKIFNQKDKANKIDFFL